jgi:hypothetical protein
VYVPLVMLETKCGNNYIKKNLVMADLKSPLGSEFYFLYDMLTVMYNHRSLSKTKQLTIKFMEASDGHSMSQTSS